MPPAASSSFGETPLSGLPPSNLGHGGIFSRNRKTPLLASSGETPPSSLSSSEFSASYSSDWTSPVRRHALPFDDSVFSQIKVVMERVLCWILMDAEKNYNHISDVVLRRA